jgi:hypothetical protein
MKTVEMGYLEHGKFFRDGQFPSDFYELAYTEGLNHYSKDIRDAIGLDLRTPLSERSGNTSFAFVPVLGKARYAFVQFQSRFENEFNGSTTNRPFFQTRFFIADSKEWRSLYEEGYSVLPSLVKFNNGNTECLRDYTSVEGSIGNSFKIAILESARDNSIFYQYSYNHNNETLNLISWISQAVLNYKDSGGVNIQYPASQFEKIILIDSIMHSLLPIIQEPLSFALDPACTAKVNLRFGNNGQSRGMAYSLNSTNRPFDYHEFETFELVNYIANSTNNWEFQHTKIFSGFNKVVELREKRREKDALFFLTAYLTGNFAKLFLNTNGIYDNEIIPLLTSKDLAIISESNRDDIRIRLLNNPINQHRDFRNWVELLKIISIKQSWLNNLLSHYIENNLSNFEDICEYFGNISDSNFAFFQINENTNILYESIKKYYQLFIQSNLGESLLKVDFNVVDLETNIIKLIIQGITNLPKGYDQTDEMWFWVYPFFSKSYTKNKSVSSCFTDLGLNIKDFQGLFYLALTKLQVTLESLDQTDSNWITQFSNDKIPEFIEINKKLNPPIKQTPLSQISSAVQTPPSGSVYILDQARLEEAQRKKAQLEDISQNNENPAKFFQRQSSINSINQVQNLNQQEAKDKESKKNTESLNYVTQNRLEVSINNDTPQNKQKWQNPKRINSFENYKNTGLTKKESEIPISIFLIILLAFFGCILFFIFLKLAAFLMNLFIWI